MGGGGRAKQHPPVLCSLTIIIKNVIRAQNLLMYFRPYCIYILYFIFNRGVIPLKILNFVLVRVEIIHVSKLKSETVEKKSNINYSQGVRISFSWGVGLKIEPTHRSIDDTLIQPKFVA